MKPEIKVYIKSVKFYLMTAIIGIEDEEGFTGIIIHNNFKYYIDKNSLYKGHHAWEDLTNGYEKEKTERNLLWESIFEVINQNVYCDELDKLRFSKIEENKIYYSYFEGKEWYFSSFNSDSNPFSFKIEEVLEGYIPNKESIEKDIQGSSLIIILIRLEKLCLTVDDMNDAELTKSFENTLSNFGFQRISK